MLRGWWSHAARRALLAWLLVVVPVVAHHETAVAAVAGLAAPPSAVVLSGSDAVLLVDAVGQFPLAPSGSAPQAQWCPDVPGQGYCTVLTATWSVSLSPPPAWGAAAAVTRLAWLALPRPTPQATPLDTLPPRAAV